MSIVVVEWTLGDRLAKARRLAGISRDDMADYLGMSPQAVSNYENDHRVPKLTVLRSWSERTGVDLDWLRYGDITPLPEVIGTDEQAGGGLVTDNKKYVDNQGEDRPDKAQRVIVIRNGGLRVPLVLLGAAVHDAGSERRRQGGQENAQHRRGHPGRRAVQGGLHHLRAGPDIDMGAAA